MKHFLTLLSVVLLPLACVGAPSYTTYFNNTHTYTNASVAGTARVNSLVVTNGISSAANWTASGTTNSTLPGVASANQLVATNAVWAYGSGTNGTFVGHPTQSAVFYGSSDFTGLSYLDVISNATSSYLESYHGVYIAATPTTQSYLNWYSDTGQSYTSYDRRITGTPSGGARIGVDSSSGFLGFGSSSTPDTFLRRAAANTLSLNGDLLLRSLTATNDIIGRTITATKAFQSYQGSLTHAGSMALDFDATTTVNQISLTGAVTFTTSNLATNRTYRLLIKNVQATNCTPTFPGWKFLGGAPSTITAGQWGMLSLEAWGTTDASVVAAYAESQ